MSIDQVTRASGMRPVTAPSAVLLALAALLATTPAAAASAVFFPRGSGARVDRHHVTVSLSAVGTVAWDTVDIGGSAADVGLIVAVKAGGRVEITARAWTDAIEEATGVSVSTVSGGACRPISPRGASASGQVEGGVDLSASGEANGGCSGRGDSRSDGGGGCVSNSSPGGGCGGCQSCKPTESGHPGCSAFATPTSGCGPLDPSGSSSGGSTTSPDGGGGASRVGPYELVEVSATDGSAARWLDSNAFEAGASFDQTAAALERDGYRLFAVRARPPTPPSVVQSLRVVTTSPAPAVPLRLLRMGTSAPVTPVTLVVLASAPQALVDTTTLRIDESRLAWTGSASNYESLVSALLGDAPSGGLPTSRWSLESARSLSRLPAVRTSSSGDGGAEAPATLADLFGAKCGDKARIKHAVCKRAETGIQGDAGIADATADVDPGDADPDAAASDAGVTADAGASDASDDASASADCPEMDRERCDDLDLAFGSSNALVATRMRGLLAGDPAQVPDLTFAASIEAITEGRYVVRDDGQPGLCEPPSSAGGTTQSDEDAQTCTQTATRARPWARVDLGPLVMFLVVIRAVTAIMSRARTRR